MGTTKQKRTSSSTRSVPQKQESSGKRSPDKKLVFGLLSVVGIIVAACVAHFHGKGAVAADGDAFLEWMRINGATVHRGLAITTAPDHGTLGLFTMVPLTKGEFIARVPRRLWLDMNSLAWASPSDLGRYSECDHEFAERVHVMVAVALEIRKGSMSFYAPMLRLWPTTSDLQAYHPFLAGASILADFGELPLLQHLRLGDETDISTLNACFDAWQAEPRSPVANLSFEEVLAARYLVKSRALAGSSVALPPLFCMMNTGTSSDVNVRVSYNNDYLEIRTSNSVAAGSELFNNYCHDCDNEMLLAGWSVYLDNNENTLNNLHVVNCSASWAGSRPAAATADSLQGAALQVLDVAGRAKALEAGWRSPRCLKLDNAASEQQALRCSLARLAWEKCATAWGYSEWESSKSKPGYATHSAMQEHVRIYNKRGVRLAKHGDLPSAAHNLRAALKIDPQYVDGLVNLGLLLTGMGDTQGADSSFAAAAAVDPSNTRLQQLLEGSRQP